MVRHLEREKYPPRDPRAVAAKIGRQKYGEDRFEEMALEGRKEQGMAKRHKGHRKHHRMPPRGKNGRFLKRR